MRLAELNALEEPRAVEALLACCGSARWAMAVARRRPYADAPALHAAAQEAWARCGREDFLEAFSRHPKIGQKAGGWAGKEQAGASGADARTLADLARGNEDYARRFGYIFIVCATGKSAAEMLALLQARLPHDPETELRVAAAEQAKITRLRLDKLLAA